MSSPDQQPYESQGSRPKLPIQSATDTALTTTTKVVEQQEQPYSSDPFHPNYRHISPIKDEQEKAEWVETWPIPFRPGFWEKYESVDHAEFTRPKDQLKVLIRPYGLDEQFDEIVYGDRGQNLDEKRQSKKLTDEEYQKLQDEMHDEARELLKAVGVSEAIMSKAEEIWRLDVWRRAVDSGFVKVEKLLEVGDVVGYNWIQMIRDIHDWAKYRQEQKETASAAAVRNKITGE